MHADFQEEWSEKKTKLRNDKHNGFNKMSDFLLMKQEGARLGKEHQLSQHQGKILNYEEETKNLEAMEAELMKQLQVTQQVERHAFDKLE